MTDNNTSYGDASHAEIVAEIVKTFEGLTSDSADAVDFLIDAAAALAAENKRDIAQVAKRLYGTHIQYSIAKEASERPPSGAIN